MTNEGLQQAINDARHVLEVARIANPNCVDNITYRTLQILMEHAEKTLKETHYPL